jgi:hypothetical protein
MQTFGIILIVVVAILFFLVVFTKPKFQKTGDFLYDLFKIASIAIASVTGVIGVVFGTAFVAALPFLIIFGGMCLLIKWIFF